MTGFRYKNIAALTGAGIVAAITYLLVTVFFQHTTSRVLVSGFFPQATKVTVEAMTADGSSAPIGAFQMDASESTKPQTGGTRRLNIPLKRIRLKFEPVSAQTPYQITLTSIQLQKPYLKNFFFNGKIIDQYFSNPASTDQQAQKLEVRHAPVEIESIQPIGSTNWKLSIGIPFLFFLGTLFLIRNSNWSQIPAFSDMSLGNRISSNGEFDTINGIRGLAALLVLLSHTAPGYEALQMGLALLFVISGFLLTKPFVLNPTRIFSAQTIENFITKRLKRILPMYYLYIVIIYVLTFKFDTALRHFFFVQAEGHLWPMTQIFAFYMMLPLILLLASALFRIHRLLPILALSTFTYYSIQWLKGWQPFYNGQYSHDFFLYAFLMGVIASYVQYNVIGSIGTSLWGKRWVREIVGAVGILLTIYIIAWSGPSKPSVEIFRWVSQFWVKCLAAVGIILFALNTPKTVFNALMSNWLFRSVGVIGFSFYILHGLGMQIFEQIQIQLLGSTSPGGRSWEFMIGAFCVTYVMSLITYSYVERPFFGYRESPKALNNVNA